MKTQTYPSFNEEEIYWNQEKLVIGVDEVGRGAFAGPIVASAVIFPKYFKIENSLSRVNDSKLVTPALREFLSEEIKKNALTWSISEVDVKTIDKIGIGEANKLVFKKVIGNILKTIDNNKFFILIDGSYVSGIENHKAIIKGDRKSFSIAAASILAKVHRDTIMKKYSDSYPNFLFNKNKGYGTSDHRDAIKNFGLCDLHRSSFNLVKYY